MLASTSPPPTAPAATSGGPVGRVLSRPLFWVVVLAILFLMPVARAYLRRLPPAPPVLSTLPAFAMTDQTGQPFGTRELAGKVWVADFIFTACPTACPILTERMAEIGQRARQLGPEFHMVSFTVDPERDSPARLAEYAARYHADPHKWSFLTGPLKDVEAAVIDGFKIGIDRHKTADDFWDIVHGEHLVLVDRHAHIRGYFEASIEGTNKLLEALGRVTNEAPGDEPAQTPAPR